MVEADVQQDADPAPLTVLVVDDDELVLDLIRRILSPRVRTVLLATGAEQAITLLADYENEIDVLVSDLTMPGMPGSELALRARRHRPRIAVLFVSGFPDAQLDGLIPAGANLLAKPFTSAKLWEAVRAIAR